MTAAPALPRRLVLGGAGALVVSAGGAGFWPAMPDQSR